MANQSMKSKKLCSLICFALIIGAFTPVISIAFARKSGRGPLEKIVYIHYKKGHVKPEASPGKGPDKDDDGEDEGYYKLLGAKWRTLPVTYYIDPRGSGLEEAFVASAISTSAEEWDSWTSSELFGAYEVIGDGSWDDTSDELDGRNELVFGDYDEPGVIAVCIVWGYFRGASGKGEIIEFDIMFDTDYTWGDAEFDLTVMDLQNIATHELGHGVGLADLYNEEAIEETMYGRSYNGDTAKRDLYFGDIAGIKELYN